MLALNRAQAQLGKITNIHEKHGREKRVTAFGFPFTVRCTSNTLDDIARGLREAIFRRPDSGDQQALIGETEYTVVVCPDLKPMQLSQEFPGYEMTITPQGSESDQDEDALFLVDVKLASFSVQPYDGGMCDVSFTATARINLEEDAVLALRLNELRDVMLTLTPPTAPEPSETETD